MRRTGNQQSGFTLIEMIVSLGLFSVVLTISVGALLVLITSSQQRDAQQLVFSNLSNAVFSMSREIASGYSYYCDSESAPTQMNDLGNNQESLAITAVRDCANSDFGGDKALGVSFVEGGKVGTGLTGAGVDRITYYYHPRYAGSAATGWEGAILRRIGNGPAELVTPSDMVVTKAWFHVAGTDPLLGPVNEIQPTVTIFIEAVPRSGGEPIRIQTTVTQRRLDT